MEPREIKDKLIDSFYKQALMPSYSMAQFTGSWGPKGKDGTYGGKKRIFRGAIVNFVHGCCLKFYEGSYYVFNGRIYEKVEKDTAVLAYQGFMDKFGVECDYVTTPAMVNYFFNLVKNDNLLKPSNSLFAFRNGVLDIQPMSAVGLSPFNKKFHIFEYHPYKYDPDAKAPMFMNFIHEVLPDKHQRDVLQMFLGLGLVPTADAFKENTGQEKPSVELCLLLIGNGANGKSVLYNIMCALYGRARITEHDYGDLVADGDDGLRRRIDLPQAIFNWSSDSDPRTFGKKNSAQFKKIVSGEGYSARMIGKNVDQNHNCPFLIFNMNGLPELYEQSDSLVRRLQYVVFEKSIPRYRQNPNLASDIIHEELPGVFNWVLRGSREIRRRKFKFPSLAGSFKNKVRSLLTYSSIEAWLKAYGVRNRGQAPGELSTLVKRSVLYSSYKQFCEDNGVENIETERRFTKVMLDANGGVGLHRKNKVDGVYYECYGVREEDFFTPIFVESLQNDVDDVVDFDDPGSLIKDD